MSKTWKIQWDSVMTTVVTGCMLSALCVLGTMVYQGAILKTNTNEATAQILIESVSKNTVTITKLVAMVESNHILLRSANGLPTTPACPYEETVSTTESPSAIKRIVSAVTLKPLWGKSSTGIKDTSKINAVKEPNADILFIEDLYTNTTPLALDTSITNAEVVCTEQQVIIDKMNKTISDRTKDM